MYKTNLKLIERHDGRFVFLGTKGQVVKVNGSKVFQSREEALSALSAVGVTLNEKG